MGLGAAWAENAHAMLGLEFGTGGSRIDRIAEACEARAAPASPALDRRRR